MPLRLLLALLVFVAGCTVSPQPTPPPEIGIAGLRITEAAGSIHIEGIPGAISNAQAVSVFKTPPFGYGAASQSLAPDGSFVISFEGTLESQLRFQAFAGEPTEDPRSEPLDLIGTPSGSATATPRFDCMTLDVGPEIDFGFAPLGVSSTQVITIRNNCATTVDITPAEVALSGIPDFVLTPLGEPSITPGEASSFEITYQRVFPAFPQAFLVFGWGAASREFRIITLFGSAQ